MVNHLNILVGKTDSSNCEWLPLWVHLKDTAGVMNMLLSEWVSDATVKSCGLLYEDFRRVALFVAYVHDIGKATSHFQGMISNKIPVLYDQIAESGLIVREDMIHRGKTPHAFAGQWILQSDTVGICLTQSVANIIGAHHGSCLSKRINYEEDLLKVYPSCFYGEEDDIRQQAYWTSIWRQIVDEALKIAEFKSITEIPEVSVNAQILLSGLLIMADWIASNTNLFPLIGISEDIGEDDGDDRLSLGWERLGFPESWHSEVYNMSDQMFYDRFGFEPNDVQKSVIEVVNKTQDPGIFILEAQMGIGKTEAALGAVEIIAGQCDSTGLFFGLPTQATCNGIYDRLYEWASEVSEETVNAIKLAHGGASFNKEYQKEIIQGKVFINDEETDLDLSLCVHPWFQGNKKALLADYVIGTVDQFLMASLKRRHFMLRHLGLSGKVVVIDECHAYDSYMNCYLDQSIEWMASYGVPVVLLSATLPQQRREELISSYIKGVKKKRKRNGRSGFAKKNAKKSLTESNAYPMLTWSDGLEVHQREIKQQLKNRTVKMQRLKGMEQTVNLLMDKLEEGGCACVILNTIKHAQEYYNVLRERLTNCTVLLYHAQFTMDHRLKKENELLKRMGKKSSGQDRCRFVLVGTQVLEQSLDYDADILITELCPMDLLLQRIGRLHRHDRFDVNGKSLRPKKMHMAECYVLLEDIEGMEEWSYDSGSCSVYGDYLLLKTLSILPSEIIIPRDIPILVQKVYSEIDDCGLGGQEKYLQAEQKYVNEKGKKQNRAKTFLLKYPKKGMCGMLDNEYHSDDVAGNMSVRDIESSIEIIIMRRYEDGRIGCVDDLEGETHQLYDCKKLTEEEGLEIARQRVYLPKLFGKPWLLKRAIDELEEMQKEYEELQTNSWLQGELIMLLDCNNQATLCGYRLYYDYEIGLVVEKEDKDG